jgi:hypothetical protein
LKLEAALATAEEKAAAKIGLWADEKPVPPWEFRHSPKTDEPVDADPFNDGPSTSTDAPKTQPKAESTSDTKDPGYWITDSSSKQHNSGCRYYRNSKGHPCGPHDGTACKICGG